MPRRTLEDAAKTRAALVDAARRLFAERGFAATTTTAVAELAGCSQSALFHHFADKAALFGEVVTSLVTAFDHEVRRAALAERSPMAMVLAGCRRSIELAADPTWSRLVAVEARAVLGEPTLRTLDASLGLSTTRLGLTGLVRSADLRPDTDVDALATVIYGALTEAAFAIGRAEPAPSAERVMAVIEQLLAAYRPVT